MPDAGSSERSGATNPDHDGSRMDVNLRDTLAKGIEIWTNGGWAMIPLAFSGFLLYSKAAQVRFMLWSKDFSWSRWKRRLRERKPKKFLRMGREERDLEIARLYLKSRGLKLRRKGSFADVEKIFAELRANELPPIDRNLRFMKVAMASAPLWGLLGTVSGMLKTFAGLAAGGGGDQTASNVAGGISEALITTQTGLMVALPGYFFLYYLGRRRDAFEKFIAHLETVCAQRILHRDKRMTPTPPGPIDARRQAA